MKTLVIGAVDQAGKSKKTGSAYHMLRVICAQPMVSKRTDDYNRQVYGSEVVEVEATVEAVAEVGALIANGPKILDLATDMAIVAGRMAPVVTGVIK